MNFFTHEQASDLAQEITSCYSELRCRVCDQEVPGIDGLPTWNYSYIAIWLSNSVVATFSRYEEWNVLKQFATIIVRTDEQLAHTQHMEKSGLIS